MKSLPYHLSQEYSCCCYSKVYTYDDYDYNLRGSGTLLTLPSFNLEWRHKSFSFLAAKLWNSLPTCVRNAKDISTFKRLLKKQVFR